ncbi:hypothetical protein PHSY_002333 [Pseudozyma hubeiensis SY62]|uniref:Uncharacterized protein n=1 Tax=Pseudozyma hubeiensis (strain SY62) TaxID=1305764 RepID=R9P9K2_PSEHS|nr:hypothetical protein PHSY_002333 [Pseudozyma hubeiensis SY62]GAC94760.1 hypothetical protein PHSY_002333 [Pseudozyma hubeiensis SY62]
MFFWRFLPLAAVLASFIFCDVSSSAIVRRQSGCAKCPSGELAVTRTYHGNGDCSITCETLWKQFQSVTATCAATATLVHTLASLIEAAIRALVQDAAGVEGGWQHNRYKRSIHDLDLKEFLRLGGVNDDLFAQYLAGNLTYTSGANMWVLAQMGLLGQPTITTSEQTTVQIYHGNAVVVTAKQKHNRGGMQRRSEEGDSVWLNVWRNDVEGGQATAPWFDNAMEFALATDIGNYYTTGVHDHVSNICDCIYTETGRHNLATGLEFSAYRKGGKPSHWNCPGCTLRSHDELGAQN